MPLSLRLAVIIPGVLLGAAYAVFGIYEVLGSQLDAELRTQVARALALLYFIWNSVFLAMTKDQHRKDIS